MSGSARRSFLENLPRATPTLWNDLGCLNSNIKIVRLKISTDRIDKMTKLGESTAERLGYAADARVLILNADDFGMCHDQNEGVIRGLQEGVFTSSTILVTC